MSGVEHVDWSCLAVIPHFPKDVDTNLDDPSMKAAWSTTLPTPHSSTRVPEKLVQRIAERQTSSRTRGRTGQNHRLWGRVFRVRVLPNCAYALRKIDSRSRVLSSLLHRVVEFMESSRRKTLLDEHASDQQLHPRQTLGDDVSAVSPTSNNALIRWHKACAQKIQSDNARA